MKEDNIANNLKITEKHKKAKGLIRQLAPVIVYADGTTPYQPDMVLLKGMWGFKIGAVSIVVRTAKS